MSLLPAERPRRGPVSREGRGHLARGTTGYREAPRSILVASGTAWVSRHS